MLKRKPSKLKTANVRTIKPLGESVTDLVAFFQNISLGWYLTDQEVKVKRSSFIFACCSRIANTTTCPGIKRICMSIRSAPENASILFDMFYYNAMGKLPVHPDETFLTDSQIDDIKAGKFNV
jgi:hypothetical protein